MAGSVAVHHATIFAPVWIQLHKAKVRLPRWPSCCSLSPCGSRSGAHASNASLIETGPTKHTKQLLLFLAERVLHFSNLHPYEMIPDNAKVTFTQQFSQSIQHFHTANDIQYGNQTDKNQVQPPRIDKTLASLKNTKIYSRVFARCRL